MMKAPKEILSVFKREKRFLVATHISPDGDTIGSGLALAAALEAMGKETAVYCRDRIPKYYRFLPGQEKIARGLKEVTKTARVLVLLDCNSAQRAGVERHTFPLSVVIDHHETGSDFGDLRWIEPGAAATGLMVYHVIKAMGVRFTREMAVNLYTAIAVDTGTFRFSNTSAEVLAAGAELVRYGADPGHISRQLYESWEEKRFRLLMMTLDTLEIKDRMAIVFITREMFDKTRTRAADTENFPNFPKMIGAVEVSASFRQKGAKTWKVSLRSRGKVNVAGIAELFGGGGHANAAGYETEGSARTVKDALFRAYEGHRK
ncbi:MAG: bifunctional oligoribonuclease/PAP phosphatase NrnA [Candidatus Sulfobium sp.]|jgi:phosphoesterase RecJ-like protein